MRWLWAGGVVVCCAASVGCEGLALFSKASSEEPDAFGGLDLEGSTLLRYAEQCDTLGELDKVIEDVVVVQDGECLVATQDTSVRGTLDLRGGSTVGFAPGTRLQVESGGNLIAEGSEDNPIRLTGLSDEAGSWAGVYVSPNSQDNELRHASIEGAGGTPSCCVELEPAAVHVGMGAEVTMDEVHIRNSGGAGVVVEQGAITDGNVTFEGIDGPEVVDVTLGPSGGWGGSDDWVVVDLGDDRDPLADDSKDAGLDDDARVDGGEDFMGECEEGRTTCGGAVMLACVFGTWERLYDCAMNVDSGTTACVLYDGQARCSEPVAKICGNYEEQLRSGIPLDDLNEVDEACQGASTCEGAEPRACVQDNDVNGPFIVEGVGSQWVRFGSFQEDLKNQVGGFLVELDSEGDYEVAYYHDWDSWADLDWACHAQSKGVYLSSPAEPWVKGTPPFTAIWPSLPGWAHDNRIHVVLKGAECVPWKLTVTSNPCASETAPQDTEHSCR